MVISLRPITNENWMACISLEPTEEQVQARFVSSNVLSLAQAHYEPWWEPIGIYVGELMVGFVMVGRWPARDVPAYYGEVPVGVDCILRFMIDGRYQRQGYGRAALAQTIKLIRQHPGAQAIQISYDETNKIAKALYVSQGFRPTGRTFFEEEEAWLELT
jgi:diamine N-acetyltransferase